MVPTFTPVLFILVVVATHLSIACVILRELEKSKARLFQLSIFTLVCPPIFADWEEFRVAIQWHYFQPQNLPKLWPKNWHKFQNQKELAPLAERGNFYLVCTAFQVLMQKDNM